MPTLTVEQIAAHVAGEILGDPRLPITGVDALETAEAGDLGFIRDAKHARGWAASGARAALLTRGVPLELGEGRALVVVPSADVALAAVLEMFAPPRPRPAPGVHATAAVDPTAELGEGVAVGPGCCVGPGVRIGDGTLLHANVSVLDHTRIGRDCELFPGVVIRDRCELGDRVVLHPNVVIGADGFAYRPSRDPARPGLVKIPHIGTVRIGSDVEIGPGTCVDRAKFAATVIGDGTKIDNLVQIAHNCRIGRHCVIAAQSGMAGSVTVGDGVVMGGNVIIKDHVTIGDGATLAGAAAVMNDVPAGQTWAGYPAREAREAFREHAAMRRLPELIKLLKR